MDEIQTIPEDSLLPNFIRDLSSLPVRILTTPPPLQISPSSLSIALSFYLITREETSNFQEKSNLSSLFQISNLRETCKIRIRIGIDFAKLQRLSRGKYILAGNSNLFSNIYIYNNENIFFEFYQSFPFSVTETGVPKYMQLVNVSSIYPSYLITL